MMHNKTCIFGLHLSKDGKGIVTAAIVNHNHLNVGKGLTEHALHAAADGIP